MKRIVMIFLTAMAAVGVGAAQDRLRIVADMSYLEAAPPASLENLLNTSDAAALVTIESSRTQLNSSGQVSRVYAARVIRPIDLAEPVFSAGEVIEIKELGGAVFTGTEIRVGLNENFVELVVGQDYAVFLNKYDEPQYTLLWGKYAVFQVLSERLVPCTETTHPYFRTIGGTTVADLQRDIETTPIKREAIHPRR